MSGLCERKLIYQKLNYIKINFFFHKQLAIINVVRAIQKKLTAPFVLRIIEIFRAVAIAILLTMRIR